VLKEKKLASSDLLAKYGDELKDKGSGAQIIEMFTQDCHIPQKPMF
jgi:hypothetical protein